MCDFYCFFDFFELFAKFAPLPPPCLPPPLPPGMLNEFGGEGKFCWGGRGMDAVQELMQARV